MEKKQHYMTWEERCQLEVLLGEKVPVAKIAKRLGSCRQTIYDEIKRRTYIHTCAYWDEERERPKICRFPGKENAGSAGGWDS